MWYGEEPTESRRRRRHSDFSVVVGFIGGLGIDVDAGEEKLVARHEYC